MNDCIFIWIGGCDGCEMGKCEKYLSVNSEEGSSFLDEYQAEVEEALKPISEKYKTRLEKFKARIIELEDILPDYHPGD